MEVTVKEAVDSSVERMEIVAFLHHPEGFSVHSGMMPLVRSLGARPVLYEATWWRVQQRSFTLGRGLRLAGNWYFGSEWNSLVPVVDEMRLARHLPRKGRYIAHFVWADFARPRLHGFFRRGDRGRIVGTFHASPSRLEQMVRRLSDIKVFDAITLMGSCQRIFFETMGYPSDRLHVVLHGVDCQFFCPSDSQHKIADPRGPLRGLMIGVTDRDHAFLARVMRSLPEGTVELRVATSWVQWKHYEGVPGVVRLPQLDASRLREEYRQADLLLMPMNDCVANNAVLEAMACGTPVMINDVGAAREYVAGESGIIMPDKDVDRWVAELVRLHDDPGVLVDMGHRARLRAEELDWGKHATIYRQLYESLFP